MAREFRLGQKTIRLQKTGMGRERERAASRVIRVLGDDGWRRYADRPVVPQVHKRDFDIGARRFTTLAPRDAMEGKRKLTG